MPRRCIDRNEIGQPQTTPHNLAKPELKRSFGQATDKIVRYERGSLCDSQSRFPKRGVKLWGGPVTGKLLGKSGELLGNLCC